MHIRWVEAEGFRGFKEPVRFDFGPRNEIVGCNGKGKSSIMEIVSFTIAGADKNGKERATDRLMNQDCSEMRTVICLDISGHEYEIERTAFKVKSKTETQILINRLKGSQDQIDSLIGNRRHFLAAFLPKFFVSLTDSDARQELMQLLPIPKHEDVLAVLADDNREAAEVIKDVRLNDPELFVSKENDYLKEMKAELLRQEGKQEEIKAALGVEIPDDIEIDRSEIEVLRESIGAIEGAKPKLEDTIQLDRTRQSLLSEYQSLQKGLSFDESFVECDNCGHKVNLNAEQEKNNQRITAEMLDVKAKGTEVSEEIERIKQRNDAATKAFSAANESTLSELRQQLTKLEANLRVTEQHNMRVKLQRETAMKARERREEVRKEMVNLTGIITNTEKRIAAAKAYLVKRCEIQMAGISETLDRLSIRLFDIVKSTGEVKAVFKIEFDGKEYKVLSTSEEIRCFLEVSKLFRKLTNREYPVFIDCAESIGEYEQPEGQTFAARFIEGLELEVIAQ